MDDICSLTLAVNIFDTAFYHTAFVWVADQVELESLTGSKNATPAFAGLMTGGLFKCTAGPRGAALAAAIGALR
jgi:hypothetical protein